MRIVKLDVPYFGIHEPILMCIAFVRMASISILVKRRMDMDLLT